LALDPGSDPDEVPGVVGETGTGGAWGTTSGLLGLKIGVCGAGIGGGICATAPATDRSRIGSAHSPPSCGGRAEIACVPGSNGNDVVLKPPRPSLLIWSFAPECERGGEAAPAPSHDPCRVLILEPRAAQDLGIYPHHSGVFASWW
jgi:hypothetical protein